MSGFHCTPLSEAKFLVKFFETINTNSTRYCILRNYKCLPHSTGGSDIDILIDKVFFKNVCNLLHTLAIRYGGKTIIRLKADRVQSFSLCGFYENMWWGVKFDVFSSYVGTNGCDILPAKDIFKRMFEFNGIMVSDDRDAAVVAFIKEVIGTGRTRKHYKEEAIQAYLSSKSRYEKPLKYYWGSELFYSLLEPLLLGEIKDFSIVKKELKRGWLFNMLKQHSLLVLWQQIVDFYLRVSRIFSPIGFSVAFLGTDGSGKSTIIEGIRPPLESALHSKLKYEHMRPNLLPSLARLLGGKSHELGKPVDNPHASESSGSAGSMLRLTYYSLDYIMGYWLKVFPDMVRKPCLYVFDRYFYDFMLDPVRSRICLPKKLVEWFRVIIPEPNLILCLGADPEVIHARKPELPLEEVTRQVDELREFCNRTPRAAWIDTGLSVEESTNQALTAIVDRMAARYD